MVDWYTENGCKAKIWKGINSDMLSIIVPVYNVIDCLEECLDSITGQTYSDLEIILVDDGSTDGSGEVCDRAAGTDDRIRVIHQDNKGLSGARNTGLKHIHGDWVAFADSDDILDPAMFETMLSRADQYSADLVVCGVCSFSREKEPMKTGCLKASEKNRICSEKEYWYCYEKGGSMICDVVWNKIYRRPLVEGILFPEGKYCEDVFVMHKIIARSDRICMIPECFYKYRLRSSSIMHKKYDLKHLAAVEALLQRSRFFEGRAMYGQERIMLRSAMYHLTDGYEKIDLREKDNKAGFSQLYSRCRKQCLLALKYGTDTRYLSSLLPFLAGPHVYRSFHSCRNMLRKMIRKG